MFVRLPLRLSGESALHGFAERGGCRTHSDTGGFHGLDLIFRLTRSSRNDGPSVTHAAARRRGLSGDEAYHRLAHMLADIRRRRLFRIPADLADHDDRMRFGIVVE